MMFRSLKKGTRPGGATGSPFAHSRQRLPLPEDAALFFRHTTAALIIADPKTGQIHLANHAAAVLTGFSPAVLTTQTLADLVYAEEWGRLKAQLARLKETQRASLACTLVIPGLPRRSMDALASWLDMPGTSLAMVELRVWDEEPAAPEPVAPPPVAATQPRTIDAPGAAAPPASAPAAAAPPTPPAAEPAPAPAAATAPAPAPPAAAAPAPAPARPARQTSKSEKDALVAPRTDPAPPAPVASQTEPATPTPASAQTEQAPPAPAAPKQEAAPPPAPPRNDEELSKLRRELEEAKRTIASLDQRSKREPAKPVPAAPPRASTDETKALQRELEDAKQTIAVLQKRQTFARLAGETLHDLNNHLMAVTGRATLLHKDAAATDSLKKGIEEIRRAAERGAALARQLGALSSSDGPAAPRTMDLAILLTSLESLLRRAVDERVTLRIHRPTHATRVVADRSDVEHSLLAGVVDAAAGLEGGGEVAVSMETRDVDQDEGESIPPGRYVCVSVTRTAPTGAQEVVARRYWPVPAAVVTDAEPTIAHARPIGRETILIAEDDAAVREIIKETLAQQGLRTLEAVTGDEAQQWYKRHAKAVDAVVADVGLPGLSAGQLRKALRAIRADVRILWLTGHSDRATAKRGIKLDEEVVLAKPFEPEALLTKLREVLQQVQAPADEAATDDGEDTKAA